MVRLSLDLVDCLFRPRSLQYPVCLAGHDRFPRAAYDCNFRGSKAFCNRYCGRGQLFRVLGNQCHCSRNKPTPKWLSSKWFRYGFLVFFLCMFGNIVFQTYLVGAGAASLKEAIKLFWTFRIPWGWTYTAGTVADWIAQFSFGFYSLMLTSTLIGLIVMALFKPRSWCTFCPMGTMTQGICKIKKCIKINLR